MLGRMHVLDRESIFRLSLNGTEQRQIASPQSVSVRLFPNLLSFGFKTSSVGQIDAEDLRGPEKGGACYFAFEGNATGLSLTLDPHAVPNAISYTLVLLTDGPVPVITRTGTLPLRRTDWRPDGKSAVVIETRRGTEKIEAYSYVSASIGRLTITRP